MKAREEHRVPLSKRCLEILAELRAAHPKCELVFSSRSGQPLSDMTLTKLLFQPWLDAGASVTGSALAKRPMMGSPAFAGAGSDAPVHVYEVEVF